MVIVAVHVCYTVTTKNIHSEMDHFHTIQWITWYTKLSISCFLFAGYYQWRHNHPLPTIHELFLLVWKTERFWSCSEHCYPCAVSGVVWQSRIPEFDTDIAGSNYRKSISWWYDSDTTGTLLQCRCCLQVGDMLAIIMSL